MKLNNTLIDEYHDMKLISCTCKNCKWFQTEVELKYASNGICKREIIKFNDIPEENGISIDICEENENTIFCVGIEFGCIHWEV